MNKNAKLIVDMLNQKFKKEGKDPIFIENDIIMHKQKGVNVPLFTEEQMAEINAGTYLLSNWNKK